MAIPKHVQDTVDAVLIDRWTKKIETAEQARATIEGFGQVKDALRWAESARAVELKPHLEEAERVRSRWRVVIDPLEKAVDAIKRVIKAWDDAIAAVELEARRKMEQAQRVAQLSGGPVAVTVPPVPERVKESSKGAVTMRERWAWELEDFSKVPDDLKVIDAGAVRERVREVGETVRRAAVLTGKSEEELAVGRIPGIRIYRERDVVRK